MTAHRIYVEKRPGFRVEAHSLAQELNENLSLTIKGLRLINIYDLFGFTPFLIEKCRYGVFGEKATDTVFDEFNLQGKNFIAVEYLPGQFDQRAASAVDCVHLLEPEAEINIRSAKLYVLEGELTEEDLAAVRHYLINPVECREKDLGRLSDTEHAPVKPVPVLEGLTKLKEEELAPFCKRMGLAMNADDLREVVKYFAREGRDPNETELRILDTYWSDHCRHTTFTSELTEVAFDESFIKKDIEESWGQYLSMREELGRGGKPVNLMDLATIGARWLKKKGILDDQEESEENNACSIVVDVDDDGRTEKWLLMFKNETHNHPTEIEPFGGAATCLGGAIRDPLSGRSYVYQAMRVTGAGDITGSTTLPGKLPQRMISRKAAQGYSSYGNQIGLATTHVHECIHPGYTAKRLEIGAVVGAVKASDVRRERPAPGDAILLLGGRTGRDGIGGATGSSKEHTEESLETCGSEVQKGNPPEERKLQRLFRRPEVTRLIKKSNDFGAGGVSVAIGELAEGLDIWLDRVPVKYSGLGGTELAISESQERMAVVVEPGDMAEFVGYCRSENIEVTHVAEVTDSGRMRMYNRGALVADLRRDFIDSAGAKHFAKACVGAVDATKAREMFEAPIVRGLDRVAAALGTPQSSNQKGLVEMFDSTVGRSTVLMPFGGKFQSSPVQVSVQKLPTPGHTTTSSMMAYGFNPFMSEWSPYHGSAYAVVEACAKVVAAGGDWRRMRFSYQEYFERMTSDPHTWGKPLAALLGALRMQVEFGLPSIGGKDSMSGSFEDIHVPPTLVAFGITTVKADRVISTDFKKAGNRIYLFSVAPKEGSLMPDTEALAKLWNRVYEEIGQGRIVAAYALGEDCAACAACKMAFGNGLGFELNAPEEQLFATCPGSIIVEAMEDLGVSSPVNRFPLVGAGGNVLSSAEVKCIGYVTEGKASINGEILDLRALKNSNDAWFAKVYRQKSTPAREETLPEGCRPGIKTEPAVKYKGEPTEHPLVFIPVFPGTNCDYDTAKAFRGAGARTRFGVFRNLTPDDVRESIVEMSRNISECHILALAGGFSSGDEPDGSGKFIAGVLSNEEIAREICKLLERGGLILGICNGFQALVKSGLLPYGRLGAVSEDSPTLFRNDINRHVSQMVTTRVAATASPWLSGFKEGDLHQIAVSHGEGRFTVSEALAKELFERGQVAFQYANPLSGEPTMESPFNPNGSCYAIEGIISPGGQILGKMGHSERWEPGLFKNIPGQKDQPLFTNAVKYFSGR